jgi:hypothetical protein
MQLAEFAFLIGAPPKWVLNTLAALRRPRRYSVEMAHQWLVARELHTSLGLAMATAIDLAERALRSWRGSSEPVTIDLGDVAIGLSVDVQRMTSVLHTRRAVLATTVRPQQRGPRAARRGSPLRQAAAWGLDVTLLTDNRRKTAEQRIRQLDSMVNFAARARRAPNA